VILGTFVKLQKANISFVVAVRSSVRVEFDTHWTDFHKIRHLSIFRKIYRENLSFAKIGQE